MRISDKVKHSIAPKESVWSLSPISTIWLVTMPKGFISVEFYLDGREVFAHRTWYQPFGHKEESLVGRSGLVRLARLKKMTWLDPAMDVEVVATRHKFEIQ